MSQSESGVLYQDKIEYSGRTIILPPPDVITLGA